MARHTDGASGPLTPSRIRWGAVLAAAVIGVALLAILTALWGALAYGSGVTTVEANLAWFVGVSAVVATFVGGLTAAWLSGVPGPGVGAVHGLTVWALILVASLVISVPGVVSTLGGLAGPARMGTQAAGEALWATFLAMLVGGLAAGIGGAVGGALTRPATTVAPHTHGTAGRAGAAAPTRQADRPGPDSPRTQPIYQPVPPEDEALRGPSPEGPGRWPYVESDLR